MLKPKITVQSSEQQPYDQIAGPALMENRLNETLMGDIDGESLVRALQLRRDDQSASLVSMQRFRGNLGGRQGSFVPQGRRPLKRERSRPRGLLFLDRGLANFPRCTARAALKATLEKGPKERWIIGSSDVVTVVVGPA